MSVQEIEIAITQLSIEESSNLSNWIVEYKNQQWDKQIEEDFNAGRLDALLDEVDAEYEQGLTKPLC
jgi:BioD-like phosphotransacetylase family protein